MLTQAEREIIEEKLLAVLNMMGDVRQTFVAFLHQDLTINLPAGSPAELVPRVLTLCIEDAYTHTPPELVKLLRNLVPHDAEVSAIVERIMTPPPAAPDPFEARILRTKLPFLDRKMTRSYLKALTQPQPTQPVVVINGKPLMGKSYTAEFIDHISGGLKGIQHCRVQVTPTQGASIGPVELARDIVSYVGGDLQGEPPTNTNLDRYTQELVNWIISEANKDKKDKEEERVTRWWFVLDGFSQEELRDDTRQLIVKLANGLTTGVSRRRHRLILLDFDRTILLLQPGLIASETMTGIPRTAVEKIVTEIIAASGKRLKARKVAAKLLEGFADPVTDLPELNSRLRDLISEVEA